MVYREALILTEKDKKISMSKCQAASVKVQIFDHIKNIIMTQNYWSFFPFRNADFYKAKNI